LRIERHLAAKTATNFAVLFYKSSLLWMDESYLGVVLFSLLFSGKRYCHQVEMISAIKLETCLWFAAGCAGYYFAYVHFLTWVGKYGNFCSDSSWNCFGVIFLGIGGCYFSCVYSCF
jgi:hypothetical protein